MKLINWLRDHPRTLWFVLGLSVMGLVPYDDVPAWIPITLSSIGGIAAARLDRRHRTVIRAARALHGTIADAHRRLYPPGCPEHGSTCSQLCRHRARR